MILAIDPGTDHSAVIGWDGERVIVAQDMLNTGMLDFLRGLQDAESTPLVIEWIESYGAKVGRETFETCRWCGRFEQAYRGPVHLVGRKKVLRHFEAADDKWLRQALIDRIGPQGTKKAPGPLFGVTGHLLSALAIAVYYHDLNGNKNH